jgi:L-lactate utilization protein LutB
LKNNLHPQQRKKKMLTDLSAKLKKNGFEVLIAANAAEAKKAVLDMIPAGVDIGLGGSQTTRAMKLDEALRERGHEVHDHNRRPDYTPEERMQVCRKQVVSPVYLTSVNAVTKDGKLVNIDNTGNRVAAMIFGPEHVIAVVGRNKVVETVHEAVFRVKNHVTPELTRRRNDKTPCAADGTCHDCDSPARLCRVTSILAKKTRGVARFTVVLVEEDLGC